MHISGFWRLAIVLSAVWLAVGTILVQAGSGRTVNVYSSLLGYVKKTPTPDLSREEIEALPHKDDLERLRGDEEYDPESSPERAWLFLTLGKLPTIYEYRSDCEMRLARGGYGQEVLIWYTTTCSAVPSATGVALFLLLPLLTLLVLLLAVRWVLKGFFNQSTGRSAA